MGAFSGTHSHRDGLPYLADKLPSEEPENFRSLREAPYLTQEAF